MVIAVRNQSLRERISVDVIVEGRAGAGVPTQRQGEERPELGGVAVKVGWETGGG